MSLETSETGKEYNWFALDIWGLSTEVIDTVGERSTRKSESGVLDVDVNHLLRFSLIAVTELYSTATGAGSSWQQLAFPI